MTDATDQNGCVFQVPVIEQTAIHFAMDSNLIHKESDEAQRQIDRQEGKDQESEESEEEVEEEEGEGGEADGDTVTAESGSKSAASKKMVVEEKRLRNQFNFSERASQTLNNPYRVSLK